MTETQVKLLGWRSVRREPLDFYRCPSCRNIQGMLYGADGMASCNKCRKKFPFDDFGSTRVRRLVAVCAGCGRKVVLMGWNFFRSFYVCSECDNIVAVRYANKAISTAEILDFGWVGALHERAVSAGSFRVAVCTSKAENRACPNLS